MKTLNLPPGSALYTGTYTTEDFKIETIRYNEHQWESDTNPENNPGMSAWINISGLCHTPEVSDIAARFNLHALFVEDVLHIGQRAKYEEYDNFIAIILPMLSLKNGKIEEEQISLALLDNTVLLFQEKQGDIFDTIRSRISRKKGRIRSKGADYLLFSLVDIVIDHYVVILEDILQRIESLEERILNHEQEILIEIQQLRKAINQLRNRILPVREVLNKVIREASERIQSETLRYFGDIYDHCVHFIERLDTGKETVNELRDLTMNNISLQMNKVMQVLTIIATIFIPLTFIVGVYGMNFENMPELKWHNGYYYIWGLMAVITIGMIIFFKRRKWL